MANYTKLLGKCKTCIYFEGNFDCHNFCIPYGFDCYRKKDTKHNKEEKTNGKG